MGRGDVSFTFLHRVEEVEMNLADGRWQSALALSLTIPDICGGIAFPDMVRRYRDGRIMVDRQKNPTRDVGGQYIRWFDEYAGEFFKIHPKDEEPYICGERCWQLRCEYLHQNRGFLNDESKDHVRFHLGINCGTSVCQLNKTNIKSDSTDIRIDIEQFCDRMCQAAKNYYHSVRKEKDFSLYNTPVLDFVQIKQGNRTNPLIIIVCSNLAYANGLSMALQQISNQILVFETIESAKSHLGKRKPVLWIITERWIKKFDMPLQIGINRPVILLTRDNGENILIDRNNEKLTILSLPIKPETLRNAVNDVIVSVSSDFG